MLVCSTILALSKGPADRLVRIALAGDADSQTTENFCSASMSEPVLAGRAD